MALRASRPDLHWQVVGDEFTLNEGLRRKRRAEAAEAFEQPALGQINGHLRRGFNYGRAQAGWSSRCSAEGRR